MPIEYEDLILTKKAISHDIAWETFDLVNQFNDTSKVIDVNCLILKDAKMVIRNCLYQICQKLVENEYKILGIQTGDNQCYLGNYNNGKKGHKSYLHEYVRDDLCCDTFYVLKRRLILVKIDPELIHVLQSS